MPGWDGAGRSGNYKRMVRKGLIEIRFEQRLEASERVSQVDIWIIRGSLKYLLLHHLKTICTAKL